MSWSVELDPAVQRKLRIIDPHAARRLRSALRAISTLEDPRTRGKALPGNLAGHWRYRVGDYRIICDIQDEKLVIVAMDLGHRRELSRLIGQPLAEAIQVPGDQPVLSAYARVERDAAY